MFICCVEVWGLGKCVSERMQFLLELAHGVVVGQDSSRCCCWARFLLAQTLNTRSALHAALGVVIKS